MADQKLQIQIETTADNSGFDSAASAAARMRQQTEALKTSGDPLEDFAASATGLGDTLERDAEGLLEFAQGASSVTKPLVDAGAAASSAGASTEKLGQIFGGLARASNGGKEGLLGLAMAAKALWASLSGGTVAVIAAIVAALAGLAFGFLNTGKSAEEAKQKIDELNKAKLDDAVKEQEALKRAADDTVASLKAEAAAREEIADYELGRRKAAVRADAKATGESAEVTEQKLVALDRQREDEKRTNALKLANDEAALRAKAQRDLEAAQKKAQQEIADAEARRAAVVAAEQKLAATKPESTTGTYGASLNGDPARQKALADLEAAREAAKMDTDARIEGLKSDSEKKKADAEAAARAAAQAKAAADLLANTKRATDPLIAATRSAEDRAKAPQSEAEKAAIEKAKSKQDEQIRRIPASIWNNRIASGDTSVDMDALRRNYPAYKFQSPAAAPVAPLTPVSVAAAQPVAPTPAPGGGTIQRGGDTFRAGAGGLEKIADALKGTTEATQDADTGDATAKAAEELKKTTEEHAKAVKDSAQKTDSALGSAKQALSAASGVLSAQSAKLSQHDADLRRIWGAIAALRSSKG